MKPGTTGGLNPKELQGAEAPPSYCCQLNELEYGVSEMNEVNDFM